VTRRDLAGTLPLGRDCEPSSGLVEVLIRVKRLGRGGTMHIVLALVTGLSLAAAYIYRLESRRA